MHIYNKFKVEKLPESEESVSIGELEYLVLRLSKKVKVSTILNGLKLIKDPIVEWRRLMVLLLDAEEKGEEEATWEIDPKELREDLSRFRW